MSRDSQRSARGSDPVRLPPPVSRLPAVVFITAILAAWPAVSLAQTKGAELVRQPKPVYPETLSKALRQGNVLLIGRIDTAGKVQDAKVVATSHPDFVEPALVAVREWQFRPATREGKPVQIAANIGLRFRLQGGTRGQIARPTLGDLAVFPADSSGKRTAPEGFPIRHGLDPQLRAEAVLDVTPLEKPHAYSVQVLAVSPSGRKVKFSNLSVTAPVRAPEVRIPSTVPVGADWEDGIWLLRYTVDGSDAGGGQFWLAKDPASFDFASALKKRVVN